MSHPSQIYRSLFSHTGRLLVASALFLSACQPIQPVSPAVNTTPVVSEFTIELRDEGVSAPAEVPSGVVTFVVEDARSEITDLEPVFLRLRPGKTREDLEAAHVSEDPFVFFETAEFLGGSFGKMSLDLQAGEHFIMFAGPTDELPAPAPFMVTDAAGALPQPTAAVQVELVDFNFVLPDTVPAGPQLWQITNRGEQWHHMIIMQLHEGATLEQFLAWGAEEMPAGPPPADFINSWSPIDPGLTGWAEFDLAAGEYMVICFLPDFSGQPPMPHFAHGMVRTLTVQ
jgi:hypothetical protein